MDASQWPSQRPRLHPPSPPVPSHSYFERGVPSGPYYDAPNPTTFLTDTFKGWTAMAEKAPVLSAGNPTHDLTEGAQLMYESYLYLAYGARQIAADLTYMRTACGYVAGTDQLKHDLARAIKAHQDSEEALKACKTSLEEAQALILSKQKRLDEEIATNNQLRSELEKAEAKLNDATYLVEAVKGSPAFLILEHNAMRRGMLWTIQKYRDKYPNLPPNNFVPLFDAICKQRLQRHTPQPPATSQGVLESDHPMSKGNFEGSSRSGSKRAGSSGCNTRNG